MMKKVVLLFAALIALASHSLAFAAAPLTPEDLFSDDRISDFAISPDGKYIAYVAPNGDNDIFTVANISTMKPTFTTQMGKGNFVVDFEWANNERILLWPGERWGVHRTKYWTGKIQAFNYDGSKNVRLWGYKTNVGPQGQSDPRWGYIEIINRLKNDPENVMVVTAENQAATKRLRSMNIYNGRITHGERSDVRKASFITTDDGTQVAQWGVDVNWTNIFVYLDKNNNWVHHKDEKDLVDFWASDDNNIILETDAGDDTYQYTKFNRITGEEKALFSVKGKSVVTVSDRDDKLIGYYTRVNGKRKYVYFDENSDEAQIRRLVEKTFPQYNTWVSNGSKDGTRRIVKVFSDVEPGKYYLLDLKAKNKLRILSANRQKIKRNRFAKTQVIHFKARDGLELEGFLTMPNGVSKNAPMVVKVHGGPFGLRDSWNYDTETQLFASNGYAVLSVNYRGSGGYGEDFEKRGWKQWGKAMQDDLTDGTLWAVKHGYADKSKMCIYGGSYGGYAAVWGAMKEPDLYKCAIGYAGVYNLPRHLDYGDINDTVEGRAFLTRTLGDDKAELKRFSPVHNVDALKAGLFLIHGGEDERVPIEHFEDLTAVLDKIDYKYEKLVAEGEGHGFGEYENQHKLYHKMLKFLARYLK